MTQTAFAALAADGKLEAIVKARVAKCVEDAINDATGYNSDFINGLKAYVKAELPMDFSGIGLAGYNAELIKMIRGRLDASLLAWMDKSISESMGDLLEPPPAEMKVSEMVKLFAETLDEHERDELRVRCKDDDGMVKGYWSIEMTVGSRQSETWRVAVGGRDGEIYSISVPYHGEITKRLFTARTWGFERALFRLYAGKTKIVRDEVGTYFED